MTNQRASLLASLRTGGVRTFAPHEEVDMNGGYPVAPASAAYGATGHHHMNGNGGHANGNIGAGGLPTPPYTATGAGEFGGLSAVAAAAANRRLSVQLQQQKRMEAENEILNYGYAAGQPMTAPLAPGGHTAAAAAQILLAQQQQQQQASAVTQFLAMQAAQQQQQRGHPAAQDAKAEQQLQLQLEMLKLQQQQQQQQMAQAQFLLQAQLQAQQQRQADLGASVNGRRRPSEPATAGPLQSSFSRGRSVTHAGNGGGFGSLGAVPMSAGVDGRFGGGAMNNRTTSTSSTLNPNATSFQFGGGAAQQGFAPSATATTKTVSEEPSVVPGKPSAESVMEADASTNWRAASRPLNSSNVAALTSSLSNGSSVNSTTSSNGHGNNNKHESVGSWRRGAATRQGSQYSETGSSSVRSMTPPTVYVSTPEENEDRGSLVGSSPTSESRSASPPVVHRSTTHHPRPQSLRLFTVPATILDGGEDDATAHYTDANGAQDVFVPVISGGEGGGTQDSPSSSTHSVQSPEREEAARRLYEGLGIGRPSPTTPTSASMQMAQSLSMGGGGGGGGASQRMQAQHSFEAMAAAAAAARQSSHYASATATASSNTQVSQPSRQPRGPPSGVEDLGERNFAARIRRKAIGGLGVLTDARVRRASMIIEAF